MRGIDRRQKTIALMGLCALFFVGCARVPPTTVPIRHISHVAPQCDGHSLVVFLPGRGGAPEDFVEHGFVKLLNQHVPHVDAIAVDAHLGYLNERSLALRMREDIILPAREKGYDNIVLVGISMGGFGSLLNGYESPEHIDALVLLAPYLGSGDPLEQIAGHGSLQAWVDTFSEPLGRDDSPWLWANQLLGEQKQRPIILGYGLNDRLAPQINALAAELPKSRVFTNEGGHKWIYWAPLWKEILMQSGAELFPR